MSHFLKLLFGSSVFAKPDRSVLFYRNFLGFQGGHLKTWNYFQHLKELPGFTPKIYFSEQSVWEQNPWKGKCEPEKKWEPQKADILFLAGLDWGALDGWDINEKKTIINLVQAVRHADPEDIRYQYLSRKAIRICVSEEITTAIKKTGRVNGPIFTIPNGIDLREITSYSLDKDVDVVISGLKNKSMARELYSGLKEKNIAVELIENAIPRGQYLKKIASAKVSLLLPAKTEGFYLPALESMAAGVLVICPDSVGNRVFCHPSINCFMPEYNFDSLFEKTLLALSLSDTVYDSMTKQALATSQAHSLQKEQSSFYEIMKNIDQIW